MTDLPTDTRLRAMLTSWHKSRRYRSEDQAPRLVRATRQTELNREFKKVRVREWPWFLIPLLVLTILDYFYLLRWLTTVTAFKFWHPERNGQPEDGGHHAFVTASS